MKFDFDTKVDRTDMASIREQSMSPAVKKAGLISCWGAEFEFPTAPCVTNAIVNWAQRGLAAYATMDDDLRGAVRNWMQFHRGWQIKDEWIVPTYGLTSSVGTICRAFTEPGDAIIGMNPVYHMTWEPVLLNGRRHVDCPLLFDGETYRIDFAGLEKALADPRSKVLTICNPHNPTGRVWNREELSRVAELVWKSGKIIYSDEIFADTVYRGVEMLAVNQATDLPVKCITATSLGKTFSITGVGQANLIIPDPELRQEFLRQRDIDHYGSFDPMMRAAYFGGYTEEGSRWVRAMMDYCAETCRQLEEYCGRDLPQFSIIRPQGTYILWIDCRGLGFSSAEEYRTFFADACFDCDDGTRYGSEPGFIRINVAAPRKEILRVFDHVRTAVRLLEGVRK